MRSGVYEENIQSMCRVSGAADETVAYIVSEWSKLVHMEYKQVRHDSVAKILYWKLCEKWRFNNAEKWYIHKSDKVLESDECKILWDVPIQSDKTLQHNRPNITVTDKKSKKGLLIVNACLFDTRTKEKKQKNGQIIVRWSMKLQEFAKWER